MASFCKLRSLTASHDQRSETSEMTKSNVGECALDCVKPNIFSDSNSSNNEAVTEALLSNLLQHGSMHYLALIQCAGSKTGGCVHKFFKNLSTSEKLQFFKSHKSKFTIHNNGRVTLNNSVRPITKRVKQSEEISAVKYITSELRKTRGMPLEVFLKYLRSDKSSTKSYFHFFQLISFLELLQKHPSQFVIDRYLFVSLRVIDDENKKSSNNLLESENAGYMNFTGADYTSDCLEFHNLGFLIDTTEENEEGTCNLEDRVIQTLSTTLSKLGSMHYLALVESADGEPHISNLKKLNTTAKFMFFENHSNTFALKRNGYVTLCSKSDNYSRKDKLVNYFISILRTVCRISCEELVKRLQDSNLDAKTYFTSINCTNLTNFLKQHPACFVVEDNSYISLRTEGEQNSGAMGTTDHVTKSSEEKKQQIFKTCHEIDSAKLLGTKSSEGENKHISKACHESDSAKLLDTKSGEGENYLAFGEQCLCCWSEGEKKKNLIACHESDSAKLLGTKSSEEENKHISKACHESDGAKLLGTKL